MALEQAGRDRRALARGAHHRERARRIGAVGKAADVVPRLEQRAGDVAAVALGLLADVEDLHRGIALCLLRQILEGHPLYALDLAPLAPPFGHAAVEVAAEHPQPDGEGELSGVLRVSVVATDQHELLTTLGPPRQAGAAAGLQRRCAHGARAPPAVD